MLYYIYYKFIERGFRVGRLEFKIYMSLSRVERGRLFLFILVAGLSIGSIATLILRRLFFGQLPLHHFQEAAVVGKGDGSRCGFRGRYLTIHLIFVLAH